MCPGGANAGLPIHSLLFANSIFEDLEPALAAESVHWPDAPSSGAPRAPPKFSAGGWSRLTQALSNSRALTPTQKNWDVKRDGKRGVAGAGAARTSKALPSKSAAASKPRSASLSPPSFGRADPKTDGEPALLLLPDGSVQIVTSPHSVAESRSPKLAGDAAAAANDDRRKPTRASDVLQNHPGYQVGSLTSSNSFLRPQQVMKPGHVYFLQPPQAPTNAAALPAPDVNGINPGDDESASAALTLQRDSATNADHGAAAMQIEAEEHALDDVTITEEGLMASILGSTYKISETNVVTRTLSNNNPTITASRSCDTNTCTGTSTSTNTRTMKRNASMGERYYSSTASSSAASSATCSPSLLPGSPSLQPPLLSLDRRNLSPSPIPSLYRTPCACCSAKRPTTPTSHFSPALTHSLTLSPTSSAATNSTFQSPMLSPRCPPSPPSPSPSLPCPTGCTSRPKAGNFFAVPEDVSFQLDSAAAQIFAAAAQERAPSPLMHRGWCTAGRSIHPQFSSGVGCNECDNDAGATKRSYSARYTGVKLATSTGFVYGRSSTSGSDSRFDNNGSNGIISNRHRRSYSRGLESTDQQGEENTFERGQAQRQHNPFRLRGRPVVTVEDMVFGRMGPSLAD
ncbi:unnamed protein product [Closterium sp. Yama58-4]|nr:unnamed protein product [Closterium sp. Yama58-4]